MREAVSMFDRNAGSMRVEAATTDLSVSGAFNVTIKLHNLLTAAANVGLEVKSARDVMIADPRLDFGTISPFGRKAADVTGNLSKGEDRIDLLLKMRCNGSFEEIPVSLPFLFVRKGLSPEWADGEWHRFAPKPADFSESAETASLHSARFKLSYDDDGLLLLVDVCDDFLFPSRAQDHAGRLVDNLELFLDGRCVDCIGRSAYQKGVCQIAVYPGLLDGSGPFHHTFSPKSATVVSALSSERTICGYRMTVRVPFATFCVDSGTPRKIGFDIAVNTANATGRRIAQYAFAGGPDNHRDPSRFRDVWLVEK
jgi:hypothetical protein